ncbi:MAG: GNAT family N-acetyltransferase [Clostridia bacterium]
MERDNIVSKIEEQDLKKLQEILKSVFNNDISYEKMKKLYKISKNSKNIHVLGYYINDKLVGTVTLNILTMPSGKEATIWDLAIMEEYRRLGIATKLMKRAEEIARQEDIKKIWLFSGFHRKYAHELYKKLGYDENRDKAFVKQI